MRSYNNKGKPVRQYEPFFSPTPHFGIEQWGVSSTLFYDPVERVVATLHPNQSWEKVVFDPWQQQTFDVNDTVTFDPKTDPDVKGFLTRLPEKDYLQTWYQQRIGGALGAEEKSAAEKAANHANTPTTAHFDTLGRTFLTIADNGPTGKYETRVELDIEGNQRSVADALGRIVMTYDYDLLGHRIHQSSMEAGQRWMLNNVAGKPIRMWDSRDHVFRTVYDALQRPTQMFVKTGSDLEILVEKTVYGEGQGDANNLRGRIYQHFDNAGVATNEKFDFKGNLLSSNRQLVKDYKTIPNWSGNPEFETEIFSSSTRYDALNRPIQLIAPHSDKPDTKLNVIRPGYNEANLLERMDVWLGETAEPIPLLDPSSANFHAVTNIDYDAKGQRTLIEYGNGAKTTYTYDQQTFRLMRLRTVRTSDGSLLQDLNYTYDPVGNITRIRDDAQQTIYFNNQVVSPNGDYTYDSIYRLIQASGREHIGQVTQPETTWNDEFRVNLPHPSDGQAMRNYTEQYVYDAVGNFEKLIHQAANGNWNRSYAYNEASLIEPGKKSNRLSSTTVGQRTEPYSYDAHGNMTSMPHLTLMQWNYRDELSATSRQAVNDDPPPNTVPETTVYVYDAAGQRVRKVTERQNGTRKHERIYLGGFEIYREFDSTGITVKLERETLHGMDDKQRIALVETKTITNPDDESPTQLIRYQFSNHLGSASLELDDKGNVISYEEYYPYGSTSYQAADKSIKAAAKRYRYTGKERDNETGFSYHGARYYAPWLGRWTSCDPSGLRDGVNVLAYVNDNPISKVDLTGNFEISWKEVAIGAAIAVVAVGAVALTAGAAGPAVIGGIATFTGLSEATVATTVVAAGTAYGTVSTVQSVGEIREEIQTGRNPNTGEPVSDAQISRQIGGTAVGAVATLLGAKSLRVGGGGAPPTPRLVPATAGGPSAPSVSLPSLPQVSVASPALGAIGVGSGLAAHAPALMMSMISNGGGDNGGGSDGGSGGSPPEQNSTQNPPEQNYTPATPEQNYTPNPNIRPHGQQPSPRPQGMQSHHPEQQAALSRNIPNYDPNADPALLMQTPQHRATFASQAAQRARGAAFERELGTPAALQEASTIMQQAGVAPETSGQVTLEHSGYLFSTTPLDEVLMCLPPK